MKLTHFDIERDLKTITEDIPEAEQILKIHERNYKSAARNAQGLQETYLYVKQLICIAKGISKI